MASDDEVEVALWRGSLPRVLRQIDAHCRLLDQGAQHA